MSSLVKYIEQDCNSFSLLYSMYAGQTTQKDDPRYNNQAACILQSCHACTLLLAGV